MGMLSSPATFAGLVFLLGGVWGRLVLQPTGFLKLPDGSGRYVFRNGAATKAAYDPQENFLYVLGYTADVMHVVDMSNPNSPQLLATKVFSGMMAMGFPDSVQVCRGGANREFLAVTFEAPGQTERAHVHLFHLLDQNTFRDPLVNAKTHVTSEGFDPRGAAWNSDCSHLVVISEGDPHQVNSIFVDPPATIEVLTPSFGSTVDKYTVPIIEGQLAAGGVRHVFKECTGANQTHTSTRVQDAEPKSVTITSDNMAYVVFQENNAIASMNLNDQFPHLTYHTLGTKDWSMYGLDASYEDGGINLQSRHLRSFYQPADIEHFVLGGKTWLVTADTGSIREYRFSDCTFDESLIARTWIISGEHQFADGLTASQITKLDADMRAYAQIGRLELSVLRERTDGWDPNFQGYDYVCTFGGRGFSILDPTSMSRVYDSGDDFERFFNTTDASEPQRAIFNALVGGTTTIQSSQFDRASPLFGPQPTAVTSLAIDSDRQVVVIANGLVGGLYTYEAQTNQADPNSAPTVTFQGYSRRGQAGLNWNQGYASTNPVDAVGEPYITDLLSFEDEGQRTVVAVSSYAGAISIYRVEETP